MVIYFITGNKSKFLEAKEIIPQLEQLDIDVEEIQSLEPKKIIEHKLKSAIKEHSGEFIVEDTSLFITCLNGFPGPLIKWFLKSLSTEGIYTLVKTYSNTGATAITHIGYYDETNIKFLSSEVSGKIVEPRGTNGFGWDCIFQPENSKTWAEITLEEKNKSSMRYKVLKQLKNFLDSKKIKK